MSKQSWKTIYEISDRLAAVEDRLAELETWRGDVEAELGEQDALDLGGAVLEDEERRQAIAERDGLFGELLNWHRFMNGGQISLSEILDRHLGPVSRRLSPAERAAAERVIGPIEPRPLTPAEVEACRVAAVEEGSGERPRSLSDQRPFSVRLDLLGGVTIIDVDGCDVLQMPPTQCNVANVDAIVAALNQAETPLQALARQVADAAARWILVPDLEAFPEYDRFKPIVERWITESGFALKAEGPG